jgi:hypothetical protein
MNKRGKKNKRGYERGRIDFRIKKSLGMNS